MWSPACELLICKKCDRSDQTLLASTDCRNSNWFKLQQLVAATSRSNLLMCTCRATSRWDQIIKLTNQMPNQTVSEKKKDKKTPNQSLQPVSTVCTNLEVHSLETMIAFVNANHGALYCVLVEAINKFL